MSVKEWVARVLELNSYLKDFPAHNGNPTQPLNTDELLDILEYGFCTRLESCEPSEDKPKGKKPAKLKTTGKCKAEVLTTSTSSACTTRFYCKMHGPNMTHDTKYCFELNWRKKRAKTNTNQNGLDKVTYKDLNAFVNAKVTAALKRLRLRTKRKSSNKESNLKVNALTAADNNDSDSNASCLPSEDSKSNNK
eukprot:14149192-Ditylum_brightwellii.AAC.1